MLDSFEQTLMQLSGLTSLKFFPSEEGARLELAKLVARMCSTPEQVDWLVARTLSLCNEWPGPLALRQIFCAKFKPADGISAGRTDLFPDGVPSETGSMKCLAEREAEKIAGPVMKELPPGVYSADPELDAMVHVLAKKLDANRPRPIKRETVKPEDPPPNPNFIPITQADVDREVEKLREKRARKELGLE